MVINYLGNFVLFQLNVNFAISPMHLWVDRNKWGESQVKEIFMNQC